MSSHLLLLRAQSESQTNVKQIESEKMMQNIQGILLEAVAVPASPGDPRLVRK